MVSEVSSSIYLDIARDAEYVEIILQPLRGCAKYLPKMGGGTEVDLDGFKALYRADPLYHWMGFDSPLMFAAHKAAGGMTSVYRQLGIGCERIFRQILRDKLNLTDEQVRWSYELLPEEGSRSKRPRELSLDGRIELADIVDPDVQERVRLWIESEKRLLDISVDLKGAVFEVRQGYKSADSKRQNADLANAAQALGHGLLPVLTLMSTQINQAVHTRYQTGNWAILTGKVGANDASSSTFDFLQQVVGYDLAAFFERNSDVLREGTEATLKALLEPDK